MLSATRAIDCTVVRGMPRWLLRTAGALCSPWTELRHQAEDLAQECILAALRRGLDPFDSVVADEVRRARMRGWLRTVR